MEELSRLSSGAMQMDVLRSAGSAQLAMQEPAMLDPMRSLSSGEVGAGAGRQSGGIAGPAFPADQSESLLNPLVGHERYTRLRNLHRCRIPS